jgi:hypothetical protein
LTSSWVVDIGSGLLWGTCLDALRGRLFPQLGVILPVMKRENRFSGLSLKSGADLSEISSAMNPYSQPYLRERYLAQQQAQLAEDAKLDDPALAYTDLLAEIDRELDLAEAVNQRAA